MSDYVKLRREEMTLIHDTLKGIADAFCNDNTEKYYSSKDWNLDAHVELTLTVKDVRRIYAVLKIKPVEETFKPHPKCDCGACKPLREEDGK